MPPLNVVLVTQWPWGISDPEAKKGKGAKRKRPLPSDGFRMWRAICTKAYEISIYGHSLCYMFNHYFHSNPNQNEAAYDFNFIFEKVSKSIANKNAE